MKPFHFPLQSLRTLREHKEQAARERYAAALRVCDTAAAHLQTANTELTLGRAGLRERLAAGVRRDDLLHSRAWCHVLESRVKECALALQEARRAAETARKELLAATRERETLEKLRDKHRRAYELELQRADQKRLDELAIQMPPSPLGLNLLARANTLEL